MPSPIEQLVHAFSKLPGVGEKTALRFALYVLRQAPPFAHDLARALVAVKERVQLCAECLALTEESHCSICRDPNRDGSIICVVEEPSDMMAMEKTGAFRGHYHVLHGALSPLDGIGPEHLRIRELLTRIERASIAEVVIATNINIEGEATALYLSRLIKPNGMKLTRLASGVPVGSDIEYIDASTLARALEERHEI